MYVKINNVLFLKKFSFIMFNSLFLPCNFDKNKMIDYYICLCVLCSMALC